MKKKMLSTVLAAGMALTVLAGTASAEEPRTLTFASQSVGTTGYIRVNAMVELIKKELPEGWDIEVSPVSAGGLAGPLIVESGDCDLGEGISVTDKMLMNGEFPEYGTLENTLGLFAGTDYAHFLIMFTEDFVNETGYTTLDELIENKVPFKCVTKAPGSASEVGVQKLLATYGVTYDDIIDWGGEVTQVAVSEMADLLSEGRAEVSLDVVGKGQPAMSELTMTKNMHFVQLSEETLQALEAEGYVRADIEAGVWNGQDEVMHTALQCSTGVVSADLPNDVVFAICKAICENKDELIEMVPSLADYFDPEVAGEAGRNGLPLHPGAIEYYESVGYAH